MFVGDTAYLQILEVMPRILPPNFWDAPASHGTS